jgi:ABC-type sugar transport system permease subunit
MVNAWFGYPFMMTVCLGALQSISPDVNEAAQIDGAGAWVRFTKITLPLLRSATLPLTLGTFAFNLNNFGIVYLLTAGGPTTSITGVNGATDILITYVYKLASVSQRYGLAAAFAVFIFIFVAGLSLINYRATGAFKEVER